MLDYAATYFSLGPVERRIYEVARAPAGDGIGGGAGWGAGDGGDAGEEEGRLEVDLATFRLQIGYQNPLANFRAALKGIAATDTITDYDLALVEGEAEGGEGGPGGGRGGRRATRGRGVTTRRAGREPGGEMPADAPIDPASEPLAEPLVQSLARPPAESPAESGVAPAAAGGDRSG